MGVSVVLYITLKHVQNVTGGNGRPRDAIPRSNTIVLVTLQCAILLRALDHSIRCIMDHTSSCKNSHWLPSMCRAAMCLSCGGGTWTRPGDLSNVRTFWNCSRRSQYSPPLLAWAPKHYISRSRQFTLCTVWVCAVGHVSPAVSYSSN